MALLPKEQAAVDAALKRGMSQQKINTFLAENPGDYSRLHTQRTDAELAAEEATRRGKKAPAAPPLIPPPQAAPAMPTPVAPPPAAVEAPMAGLTAIAPEPTATPAMPQITGGGEATMLEPEPPAPTGVATTALGQLRNLGRRTPPVSQYAFQGLKNIY